ncbi:hypothetical protein [Cohnella rhizosphaerae]|uniref:DUF58 domain-containing protein n=1 Tax=Cohnella rhizosphaerae TaxID=1457232 RepID=A0A9X4KRA8_9BACL|nr:hypothetical protein [Cohnella rhizosphaerae]MDG0809372.1 hypothetical protein [Cohnella rhizosphaerae]
MPIIKLLIVAAVLAMAQRLLFGGLGLRKIRYERRFSAPRAFAGDKIWLEERLVNAKWLPLPWLRAETQMPAALRFGKETSSDLAVSVGQTLQNHASLFTLGPYTRLVRRHEVTCLLRGAIPGADADDHARGSLGDDERLAAGRVGMRDHRVPQAARR